MRRLPAILGAALAGIAMPATAADWKATEQTRTYAISGTTGIALYESIGRNGPLVGKARTVAHTTFDLKWSRKYEPQADGSCRLTSARPFLTITYTLPKPSEKLPAGLRERWATFIGGIERHEKVHGEHIRDLVDTILATTVGLAVADDPGCRKIREEIKKPLSAASLAQRQKSRDFDRVEMSEGGNVHRLILDLVNGG